MLNNMGLGFIFTARDLASSKVRGLDKNFRGLDATVGGVSGRLSKNLSAITKGMGAMVAGGVLLGGAFSLADKAGKFEQGVIGVGQVARATATELEMMADAAFAAGLKTQFSPDEAVAGLRTLAQAGFNAQDSMRLLTPALNFATASLGKLSPEDAAGIAAQTIKAFGVQAKDATFAMDQLTLMTNSFAISMDQLPLGLGHVSKGAQTMNQSFQESMIALGLVKNVIPTIERGANAVAVAMTKMVDPKAQKALKKLGVEVLNSKGGFNEFLDIMAQLAPKLQEMTEGKRSAFLVKTFGKHAMGGVNAILGQLTNGITTVSGEVLKGADAVAYYRNEFKKAGGTMEQFTEKMLDTFAGQKTLLTGVIQSLAVAVGEPFAQVLKPIVGFIKNALESITLAIKGAPPELKRFLAGAIGLVGGILALGGAGLALKGILGILGISIKGIMLSMGSFLISMLPVIAVIAVLALAIKGFKIAIDKNIGGIGEAFSGGLAKVKLFFEGLGQALKSGEFSGKVRTELNKANNSGLKQFIISVYAFVWRIGKAWDGLASGFAKGVGALAPLFSALRVAFSNLGNAITGFTDKGMGSLNKVSSSSIVDWAEKIGFVFSVVVGWFAKVVTGITNFVAGIINGFASVWPSISGSLGKIMDAVGGIFGAIGDVLGALGSAFGGPQASMALTFGEIIGTVFGKIVDVFLKVVSVIAQVGEGFASTIAEVVPFKTIFKGIGTAVDSLVNELSGLWQEMSQLLGITGESEFSWRTVGEVIGWVASTAITILGFAIKGVIEVISFLVRGVRMFIEHLVLMKNTAVYAGSKIAAFFTETIPEAFNAALGWITEKIAGFRAMITSFVVGLRELWQQIVANIKTFFQPVVSFFNGLVEKVKSIWNGILAFVIDLIRKIPDAFLPESLEKLKGIQVQADVQGPPVPPVAQSRTEETRMAAALASGARPAVAAAGAVAGASPAPISGEQIGSAVAQALAQGDNRTIKVQLQVGEDTLAEVTARANQGNADRSFSRAGSW